MENLIKGQKYNVKTQFTCYNYVNLTFLRYEKENCDVILAVFEKDNGSEICFDTSIPEVVVTSVLEIGQKVKWVSGNVESIGVVLEEKGEFITVVTHYIAGKRCHTQIDVKTELLIKTN